MPLLACPAVLDCRLIEQLSVPGHEFYCNQVMAMTCGRSSHGLRQHRWATKQVADNTSPTSLLNKPAVAPLAALQADEADELIGSDHTD
ncbi:MAG: hypothetical protein KDB27_10545 [Planctomycetales bacterium]|nr:hypothetical protein [Planctomycetales bacterium]